MFTGFEENELQRLNMKIYTKDTETGNGLIFDLDEVALISSKGIWFKTKPTLIECSIDIEDLTECIKEMYKNDRNLQTTNN